MPSPPHAAASLPSGGESPPALVVFNEALMLGALRQHELTEAADGLNAQLRAEMLQRQQAEAALRESEARFRSLFASAPMAVFACDRDSIIQQFNRRAAELWGRKPLCGVERFGGSLRLWLPDGTLMSQAQNPMVEVLRTGLPLRDFEVILEQADGTLVPVLANFSVLQDDDGGITGVIVSFIDLTDRKRFEKNAFRSQRMESIGTMAGGIAHNLNNSLTPILMSLELLRLRFHDPASLELLNLIEASAKRGADMVQQVLSFARGVEGHRVELRVPELLAEIETIVRETFLRHIAIEMRIAPDLWTVSGDATQLHQVLLNLCVNARDAMPAGGLLSISATNCEIAANHEGLVQNTGATAGCFIRIEVADNGSGIPLRTVEKIFDPFFTTKEVGQGSGLGLSTSLAIVHSHGGFIQVESEVGKGTTFRVFLPAQRKAPAPEPPAVVPITPALPRGNGQLLLVVDDEPSIRKMLQHLLENFGYRVVLACQGAEALAIYEHRHAEIAAVLTDMTMPIMDGPEVIRRLRALEPTVPIIGSSGFNPTTYTAQFADLGVKHFLSKPYKTAELLTMIQQILVEADAMKGPA